MRTLINNISIATVLLVDRWALWVKDSAFIYSVVSWDILTSVLTAKDLVRFTFTHLADAFIQSDLQCIQAVRFWSVCVFLGNRTHNLCTANTMLYHWATGTPGDIAQVWGRHVVNAIKRGILFSIHLTKCHLLSQSLLPALNTCQIWKMHFFLKLTEPKWNKKMKQNQPNEV